jgi:hypothetical protein
VSAPRVQRRSRARAIRRAASRGRVVRARRRVSTLFSQFASSALSAQLLPRRPGRGAARPARGRVRPATMLAGGGGLRTATSRRGGARGGGTRRVDEASLLRSPVPDLGLGNSSDEGSDAWDGEEHEARAREGREWAHGAARACGGSGAGGALSGGGAACSRARRADAGRRRRAQPAGEEGSGMSAAALRRSARRQERGANAAQASHTSLHALGAALAAQNAAGSERWVVGAVLVYASLLLLSGARARGAGLLRARGAAAAQAPTGPPGRTAQLPAARAARTAALPRGARLPRRVKLCAAARARARAAARAAPRRPQQQPQCPLLPAPAAPHADAPPRRAARSRAGAVRHLRAAPRRC